MNIRIGRILAIGIPLGILCAVIKNYFNISNESFAKYYLIFGIATILLAVAINVIFQAQFIKKLNELSSTLLEEKDIEQFIGENYLLLNKTKGKYHKALIHINLSAGYCEKGEFETAKEALLSVPEKALRGVNRSIYYINLTYIYFRLHEIQNAIVMMDKFDKDLSKLQNHLKLGGNIAILRVFNLIYKEEIEAAKALLSSSKEKWTDDRLEEDWEHLKKAIVEKESENI